MRGHRAIMVMDTGMVDEFFSTEDEGRGYGKDCGI